jgi:hypothetical protein
LFYFSIGVGSVGDGVGGSGGGYWCICYLGGGQMLNVEF